MKKAIYGFLTFALVGTASCQESSGGGEKTETSQGAEKADWKEVQKVWSGAAELSRYEFKINRYGEDREGEAVLIFVREPFLEDRHVKDESGKGQFEVLKMNFMREFRTGLYPYHTMVSVFQPLQEGSAGTALKVTTSAQDWCGHGFMQTDRRAGTLKTEVRSYFEKEDGGTFEEKGAVLLEDEVWTSLRIDPWGLPVGEVKMVPGSLSTRLSHQEPVAATAQTRWLAGSEKDTVIYEISYPESGRKLAIEIQKKLPYSIQAWQESKGQLSLSSGKLKDQVSNSDYWNYGSEKKGKKLRSKLGFKD